MRYLFPMEINSLTELVLINTIKEVPEPTPKFVKENRIEDQFAHIVGEIGEVSKELEKLRKAENINEMLECEKRMCEELSDVIFSSYTALEIAGYDEKDREQLFSDTIKKNRERGYYEVEERK